MTDLNRQLNELADRVAEANIKRDRPAQRDGIRMAFNEVQRIQRKHVVWWLDDHGYEHAAHVLRCRRDELDEQEEGK